MCAGMSILFFSQQIFPSADAVVQWGKIALGLGCSLSSRSVQWKIDSVGMGTVRIENTTSERITYPEATAGFELGAEFWGPVKLGDICENLKANDSFPFTISPHEVLTY